MKPDEVNKRTVLLVGSFPPPYGGQSVHIKQLFRHLRHRGFNAVVLNTGVNKEIEEEGIVNVTSSAGLLKNILSRGGSPVVHLHVSNISDFGKVLPVLTASRVKGLRWAVTLHSGNIEEKLGSLGSAGRLLVRMALREIDRVVCVNEVITKAMALWTNPEKLVLIPAFGLRPSSAELSPAVDSFITSHSPLISCTGFYEEIYGFDLAVTGIAELRKKFKDIGLILMGDRRGSEECEAMIRGYGLADNVFLAGNVEHDECLAIMKRSTLFLRPTTYDGDAISVREALALGVPVVASSTEFRPDGVETFTVGDLGEMMEKIEKAIESDGAPPGEPIEETANLDRIIEVYEELLAS